MTADDPVILFDGQCNLCNGSVQFVLKHERRARYRFASLRSAAGQALLADHGLLCSGFDSFVLIQNGRAYTRSDATLRVAKQLRGLWPVLSVFLVVPRVLRDAIYDFAGARRYRWFGKATTCWVNTPQWRARFIEGA
ncbi:MAG: DUF393 domain-containing protein [Gammaproteobacteria bacterium]|nr:DUF393 domain-containing protein [Gammaproteobacteria bacterium]